jgi:hypothetical protein
MTLVIALMLYPILFVVGRSLMSDVERAARPLGALSAWLTTMAYEY